MHPDRVRRSLWFVAAALTFSVGEADAQCTDGSPPPCPARAASAPKLNPREWIVVPFNNVTRAPDVDWLREASVNLLTLELGRWTDVQVVNDKRVGDLLRELPADRRGQALTLGDGLALARRAGAGMLVMGDFVKFGAGARLSANVFDVRTGNRVRTAEHRLGTADSLLAAFGPLSRDVLAVPPPPDARSGDIGTTKLDAYQAYLAGVRALNRWDMSVAERELRRALALDSTFALAHFHLAMVMGWTEAFGTPEYVAHALAAQRLGASLPPRERALIAIEVHITRSEFDAACQAVSPLVARDSNDVLAVFQLGECAFHDNTVILPAWDTLPGRYKWGWNLSLESMRRVLQLDPTFHVAFRHVLEILRAQVRGGCGRRAPGGPCEDWRAVVRRDGDTLLMQPVSYAGNRAAYDRQLNRALVEKPVVANLAIARRIAEAWLAGDSTDAPARIALAGVLESQGRVAEAEAHFRRVGSEPLKDGAGLDLGDRMGVSIKAGDATASRAWFDSLLKRRPDWATSTLVRSMELTFAHAGRFRSILDSVSRRNLATSADPAAVSAWARLAPRVLLGLPVPEIAAAEAALLASMKDTVTCGADCRANRVAPSLFFAMRAPRAVAVAPPRNNTLGLAWQPALAIAARDTAALRTAAVRLDSSAHARVSMLWPDDGHAVVGGEAYLALGDSTNALRMLRFAVDSAIPLMPIGRQFFGLSHSVWWSRAMLMRAELAAALKATDEARAWYDRVLDLWANADAEFQPDIARIRASRVALGVRATP